MRKLRPIIQSEFYWAFLMQSSIMLLILFYIKDKDIFVLIGATIFFILAIIINHVPKVKNNLDYGDSNGS